MKEVKPRCLAEKNKNSESSFLVSLVILVIVQV